MCNDIKCAIQSTVDLINININRDGQEECANRLYRVCTHSFPVAQMVEHSTSNAKIMGSIPRESKS